VDTWDDIQLPSKQGKKKEVQPREQARSDVKNDLKQRKRAHSII